MIRVVYGTISKDLRGKMRPGRVDLFLLFFLAFSGWYFFPHMFGVLQKDEILACAILR